MSGYAPCPAPLIGLLNITAEHDSTPHLAGLAVEGAGRGAPRTLLGRGGRVAEAAVCPARGRLAGRGGAAGRGAAPRRRPRPGEGPRPGHGVQRAVEGGGAAHHAGLRRHARCGRTEARLDICSFFWLFLGA